MEIESMKCDKKIETEHVGSLPINFFSEELILTDDHKVTCYTGHPNAYLLSNVFELVILFLVLEEDITGSHLL